MTLYKDNLATAATEVDDGSYLARRRTDGRLIPFIHVKNGRVFEWFDATPSRHDYELLGDVMKVGQPA